MSNTKHFQSETIQFQNDHYTVAKPLVLSKFRIFTEIFSEYNKGLRQQMKEIRKIEKEIEAELKKDKNFDRESYFEERAEQIDAESDYPSYADTLAKCSLVAIKHWGVRDRKEQSVEVDLEYVEDNLDMDTMRRICEVAGSMKLGDIQDDVEGKAKEAP